MDDCISEDSAQKQAEKVLIPSQEQVFAECSQKRILGLLAAMLPPFKSVSSFYFQSGSFTRCYKSHKQNSWQVASYGRKTLFAYTLQKAAVRIRMS